MSKSRLSKSALVIFGCVALVAVGATATGAVWYMNRLKAKPDQASAAEHPRPDPAAEGTPSATQPGVVANPPVVPKTSNVHPPLQEHDLGGELALPGRTEPIIYLEPPAPDWDGRSLTVVTGLLRRELYRQGVLLAARDELGLSTRDGTLGELPPADLSTSQRLRVTADFVVVRPHRVVIESAGRQVWKAEAATQAVDFEQPMQALATAEPLSRRGYVHALKRAGLEGKPNRVDPAAAVPESAARHLDRMTVPDQLFALRELHATTRTAGESPAILGALSRAYAQVGMLTDAQWGALPWVCKARALLYAERLRQRDPASPWGAWHRGYAAALAGLHSAALADFHAADGLRAKAPGDPPVPTWVTLAAALCRFDSAHLKTAFSDERFGDIARVFHFLTVESAGSRALALQAGQALVLKNPECFRVYDALVSLGIGVRAAEAHRAFGDSFPRRVREAPGIPASVSEALAKSPSEPDLVRRLVEAGQVKDDRNEPSWAVLGRYAQEARMVQVAGRMRYLREDLGAPADDFFEESRPLVAGHPLFPYLESLLIDPAASPREHEAKLRAARTTELTYRQLGFLGAHQRLGRDQFVRSTGVAENHGDMLYYDLSLALRLHPPERNTSQFARRMLGVSSFAPLARAAAIVHDPAVPASYLAGWEREAQHPEVFEALAVRAFREARFDDQQRHLQQAIAASPELNTYRILAELRKADGDIDGWLAALNEFLKGPDAGLDHARVRVELAEYFLSKKDYPRALAYAEPATQSEASWALLCAVRCAEAAGDWAKAEQWAKRVAERFPEFAHVWFYWCHRTGRGDVKAAANSVEEYLKKSATRPSPQDLILAGAYRELTGQPALAPALYMTAYERTRADPLILAAATVCDSLGDADGRSRATSLLPETSPYASLVTLVATALSEGEKSIPDKERLTRMLERLPRGLRETGCYYAGMLLRKRGETELAKKLLTQALEDSEPKHRLTPTLAAVALRDMEKKK